MVLPEGATEKSVSVSVNSGAEELISATLRVSVPGFLTRRVRMESVLTCTWPNFKVSGETEMAGAIVPVVVRSRMAISVLSLVPISNHVEP